MGDRHRVGCRTELSLARRPSRSGSSMRNPVNRRTCPGSCGSWTAPDASRRSTTPTTRPRAPASTATGTRSRTRGTGASTAPSGQSSRPSAHATSAEPSSPAASHRTSRPPDAAQPPRTRAPDEPHPPGPPSADASLQTIPSGEQIMHQTGSSATCLLRTLVRSNVGDRQPSL